MDRFDPWTFVTTPTTTAPEALEALSAYRAAREAVDAADEALWRAERALAADRAVGADNAAVHAEYQKALAAWQAAHGRLRTA